jgi:hypothetical protein
LKTCRIAEIPRFSCFSATSATNAVSFIDIAKLEIMVALGHISASGERLQIELDHRNSTFFLLFCNICDGCCQFHRQSQIRKYGGTWSHFREWRAPLKTCRIAEIPRFSCFSATSATNAVSFIDIAKLEIMVALGHISGSGERLQIELDHRDSTFFLLFCNICDGCC